MLHCSVMSELLRPWGFSRQEDWTELPGPSPGNLPNPGIEPRSPEPREDSLLSEPSEKLPHFKNLFFSKYLVSITFQTLCQY